MDAYFLYCSIYDRFIHVQRQPGECVRTSTNFFFENFSSETIDWTFTKIHRNVP